MTKLVQVVVVMAAFLVGTGCVGADQGEMQGDGAASIQITPDRHYPTPPAMEAFLVESDGPDDRVRSPLGDRQMWPHPLLVEDPCDCATEACIDTWVDHNLGCNVCVVLYCDGHPSGHACSDCTPTVNGP